MGVLGEYHRAMGTLVHQYGGTLERFTGDGVMVFFNDPIPYDDAAERAVRMAIGIRDAVRDLSESWRRRDMTSRVGNGHRPGYATLGRIGFEGRFDYSAIGSVTNRAARLCAEARGWQVLVSDRVLAAVEDVTDSDTSRRCSPRDSTVPCGSQHHFGEGLGRFGMTQPHSVGRPPVSTR